MDRHEWLEALRREGLDLLAAVTLSEAERMLEALASPLRPPNACPREAES